MSLGFHLVFCDGACSGNPGPGGWGAVVFAANEEVIELGGGTPQTTNNQMEILALAEVLRFALRELDPEKELKIFTDSKYVIQGLTQWIYAWQKKGWLTVNGTPVANQDWWQQLYPLWRDAKAKFKVSLNYVAGHSGASGNDRADLIAVSFSKSTPRALYRGGLSGYELKPEIPSETPGKSQSKSSSAKALGYLSLVDGKLTEHQTWAQCEKEVKGKPKALFRKFTSEEEKRQILSAWGVKADFLS